MNGVDYTRQLAKERDYFRDAVKKTKESNERRLADVEQRHEAVQDKQAEAFVKDKAAMEKSYKTQLDKLNDKTTKVIEENADDYNKRIDEERSRFSKDSHAKRKEFDQKFADIKNSYRRSFENEEEHNKNVQDVQKKNYDTALGEFKRDSDQKIQSYKDKVSATGGNLKDQYNHERQQLVRAHEDHLKAQQKENAHKNEELKYRIGQDIRRTREAADADAAQAKQYAQDSMTNMRKKFEDRTDTMATDFSQRNKEISERQKSDNLKTNRENQDKLTEVERRFNGALRDMEIENRRGDNGSGEFAQVMAAQKGLNDKIRHEGQMKTMQQKLVDSQRLYQERAEKEQDSFNETLKTENTDASVRLERKMNEMNAAKVSTVAKERDKNQKQLENTIYKGKLEKENYERQLVTERQAAKVRLDKLKENFNKSMVALDEKNKAILQDVTKTNNQDKAEFVKKMNEARNQEVFAMKREFTKMVDSLVEDYEKRIGNYQRDNEQLKLLMDQKVQNIVDQSDKKVASQRKNFEEQRSAEAKAQALMNDQREYQHKTQVAQMTNSFQKKMDKLQTTNETRLKLLTNDYEHKLNELRASTTKTISEKDINQQMETERLKQAFEAEKTRLITGYENQLAEQKKSYMAQVDALKDYKRLS